MNRLEVEVAMQEAREFLSRAEQFITTLGDRPYNLTGSRESGALRRKSMDLTRALANMRGRNS